MSRKKKKHWSEVDYYDPQNTWIKYRKPYDYGGYHNPQYNQRVNQYKQMHIDPEDFPEGHGLPVDELEKMIPYPDPPREFNKEYTEEKYEKDCYYYKKRYKAFVLNPEGSRDWNYGVTWIGRLEKEMTYKKAKADDYFYEQCKEYWKDHGITELVKPIYFTEEKKFKDGETK